jgi:hypothetical protein
MQLRLGRTAPTEAERARVERRSTPATVVSVLLHIVLGVVLWRALQVPVTLERLFGSAPTAEPAAERLQYVVVGANQQQPTPKPPATARPRPSAAPQAPPVVSPPLVAPREIPSELPRPTGAATGASSTGTREGSLTGGSPPTKGVAPTLADPRVWTKDSVFLYAPKTDVERLDSALATTLKRKQDSIAANSYTPNKFERGDWTVERNGKKYGIDQQYIHLGNFSIPTALLALLPFNKAAGPMDPERARTLAFQHNDLLYHAQTAVTEQEFRDAVRAIRERKEREHKQQLVAPARHADPHVIVAPGERPPP